MICTLDDFAREFTKICDMGWVTTHRSGPTGVGKTLEDLLGIAENNIDGPDFGDYELKSCRLDSNSMLTLFTKTPQPKGAANTLRITFGYLSDNDKYHNDEKILHSTLSADKFVPIAGTGHSLKIVCSSEKISIIAEDGNEYAYWSREQLNKAFEKKYKNKLVYVKAQSRGKDENEEFRYVEAYEISGFNYEAFVNLLEQGKIYIDLRIGQYHGGAKDGKTHDHGTGFRIKEIDQPLLFKVKRKID